MILFFVTITFLSIIDSSQSLSNKPTCRRISSLSKCSWIDYVSWYPALRDPKKQDDEISATFDSISDSTCQQAYLNFQCASVFPQCSNNKDGPKSLCRATCLSFANSCPTSLTKGLTESICNALPEGDCTGAASTLRPNGVFVVFVLAAFFCCFLGLCNS